MFLGLNQYFVASDVGNGKMQWYAFHGEPPSSADSLGGNFTPVFNKRVGKVEINPTIPCKRNHFSLNIILKNILLHQFLPDLMLN